MLSRVSVIRSTGLSFLVGALLFSSLVEAGPFSACDAALRKVGSAYDAVKLATGGATKNLSAEAYKVFDKIYKDPGYVLSEAEKSLLVDEGVYPMLERYRASGNFVKELNRKYAIFYRSSAAKPKIAFPAWVDNLPGHKITEKVLRTLIAGGKFLLPPLPSPVRYKVAAIYSKVLQDSSYLFNESELRFLKRWSLGDDIVRFKSDLDIHQSSFATLSQVRTVGTYVKWGLAISAAGLGLVGNKNVSTKKSFDEDSPDGMSRYDEKVELIFMSPMPHASVRMGGIVYNYGVFKVDRLTLTEFQKMVGFGDSVSGSHTRIELNLTPEEKVKLRDYLEDDVGKVYPLFFPFNDCVSQSNKAIASATGIDVPAGMDRSQAGTIAYYKLRHMLGSDKVGDITFASNNGETAVAKAKDATVNVLDSLFFLKYAGRTILAAPLLDRGI